ncbi:MAG: hypothetical protein ACFE8G_09125 [Candidatus Hermodarchaeota archaeon]
MSLEKQLYLLICKNCGASGELFPYTDANTTIQGEGARYKVTTTITVTLCSVTSQEYDGRKDLVHEIGEVSLKFRAGHFFYNI